MIEPDSFVIYTHSVPQAELLVEHLVNQGYKAYGDDLSDAAMVFVVDTNKSPLLRTIGYSGLKYDGWEICQLGQPRGMKKSVAYVTRGGRRPVGGPAGGYRGKGGGKPSGGRVATSTVKKVLRVSKVSRVKGVKGVSRRI